MNLEEAIVHALNGNAVLFLGSGFSINAIKSNGDTFNTAAPLSHKLLTQCGFKSEDLIDDLSQASQIYQDLKSETELIAFMKKEYTAVDVTHEQQILAKLNWQRVYTTNYDNVFELAALKNRKIYNSVVLSDRPTSFLTKSNICVHINGDIQKLSIDTINSQFKLTNKSYLTEDFHNSEWITLFKSDLKTARAVIYIGYSMNYDLDLKRIIFATPKLAEKSFFILWDKEPRTTQILIKPYGTPCPIGVNDFAHMVEKSAKDHILITKVPRPIICFREPKLNSVPPSFLDVDEFNLLFKGESDLDRLYYCYINNDDFKYSICRTKIAYVLGQIEKGIKNLLVHSDLGNGKTTFIELLSAILYKRDYRVYIFEKNHANVYSEIEEICKNSEPTVIIIEDYLSNFDIIESLKLYRTNQILIVSERSAMNDIGYDKLSELLGDFDNIDLNRLDDDEIEQAVSILNLYGFWSYLSSDLNIQKENFIKDTCNRQIKNVILKLLKSPFILNRFDSIIKSLKEKSGFYEAIIFILISQVSNIRLDLEDLAYGLNVSKLNSPNFKTNPIVKEFVDFDNSKIRGKSSIVSHVLLQEIFDSTIIIDVMLSIFTQLDHYRHIKEIKSILSKMMVFTVVQQCINKEDPNYKYNLLRYYEGLKSLSSCHTNPYFWLQYAIVKLSEYDYVLAQTYFNTAYSYARKIENFDTYKIDNHYARFILENEIKFGSEKTCMDAFKHAHSILMDPKHLTEVRYYPYRVSQNYFPFYERFFKMMNVAEKKYFLQSCKEILGRLSKYKETATTMLNARDIRKAEDLLLRILKIENYD